MNKQTDKGMELDGCVFCEKYKGRHEGSTAIFEPLNPVVPGHLLVIPLKHVTNFINDPDTTAYVMRAAAQHAKRLGGQWNLITSAGKDATQSVFHLHVHLVPRRPGDGLQLPWTSPHTQAAVLRRQIELLENRMLPAQVGLGESETVKVTWRLIKQLKLELSKVEEKL